MGPIALSSPETLNPDSVRRRLTAWVRSTWGWRRAEVGPVARPEGAGGSAESMRATVAGGPGRQKIDVVVRVAPESSRVIYESDLERQFAVLQGLAPTQVPAPAPLGLELDPDVLGAPFLVMSKLPGQVPSDFPTYHQAGFVAESSPVKRRRIWEAALDRMAEVGWVDTAAFAFLDMPDRGSSPLRQLLRYLDDATDWSFRGDVPAQARDAHRWLEATAPESSPGLAWGDARMGNLLFVDDRCTGVLDWESASLAGPLVDLGWWLLFDRLHQTDFGIDRLPGLGTRAETVDGWERRTGLAAKDLGWYEALAAFGLLLRRARAAGNRQIRTGEGVPPDDPRSTSRLLRTIEGLIEASRTDAPSKDLCGPTSEEIRKQ